jgi:hypothetical protein
MNPFGKLMAFIFEERWTIAIIAACMLLLAITLGMCVQSAGGFRVQAAPTLAALCVWTYKPTSPPRCEAEFTA